MKAKIILIFSLLSATLFCLVFFNFSFFLRLYQNHEPYTEITEPMREALTFSILVAILPWLIYFIWKMKKN